MALYKETIERLDERYATGSSNYFSIYETYEDLEKFAQAIYALGVKDERERLAKKFDEAGWHPYAEVIRG